MNCSGNYTLADPHEEMCDFEIDDLRNATDFDCTSENDYGYYSNKPCVLLKINKVQMFVCLTWRYGQSGSNTPAPVESHSIGLFVF